VTTTSLDRLASAAWSFAISVVILAALTALLLQAFWDLGLRKVCQRAWFLQWWLGRVKIEPPSLDFLDFLDDWTRDLPKWLQVLLTPLALLIAIIALVSVLVWRLTSFAFPPYSTMLLLNLSSWRLFRRFEEDLSSLAATRIHSYYSLPPDRFCAQIASLVQVAQQPRPMRETHEMRSPSLDDPAYRIISAFVGEESARELAHTPRTSSPESEEVPEPFRAAAFKAERAVDDLQAFLDRRARIWSVVVCEGLCLAIIGGLMEPLSDPGPKTPRMFFAIAIAGGVLAPVIRKWLEEKVIG
jgi:hypothetical protein